MRKSAIAAIACVVLLAGCPNSPPVKLTPLSEPLQKAGYIILPLPDNKARPGAVVQVTQDSAGEPQVRWLADFRSCGLTDKDMGLTKGIAPDLSQTDSYSVDAGAVLAVASINVNVSPQLQAARTAALKVSNDGADALDLITLSAWFADPAHVAGMPAICRTFLAQPNVYLVSDAFRVSSGLYELKDSAGAKIDLKALSGQNLSANGNVTVNSDGSLTISSDQYIAVKNIKQVSLGNFATMGANAAGIPSADAQLKGKNVHVIAQ